MREPHPLACADCHRPTTARGWVTFEIRDADAKGLVVVTCAGVTGCDQPARIRLAR